MKEFIFRLDSASSALILTERNLLLVDTNNLSKAYDTISSKLHKLTEKLLKDTVNKKTAVLLSISYEETANIQNLLANKKNLTRIITESKQRINNLKHDLKDNLIEENKSNEYVINEINSTGKISYTVNKAIKKAHISFNKLDSLKTELTFLEDSLKN